VHIEYWVGSVAKKKKKIKGNMTLVLRKLRRVIWVRHAECIVKNNKYMQTFDSTPVWN